MNKTVSAIVLLILASVITYNYLRINSLDAENQRLIQLVQASNEAMEEEIEVADIMNKLQLYMNKIWFAQLHSNWPLIEFYIENKSDRNTLFNLNTDYFEDIDDPKIIKRFNEIFLKTKESKSLKDFSS